MLKYIGYTILMILCFNNLIFANNTPADNIEHQPRKIENFTAKYDLKRKSDSVGEAIFQLDYQNDGSAKYSYKTDAKWFIFSDRREEYSIVNFENNSLILRHYYFKRSGTGKDKHYEWLYDLQNHQASDLGRGKELKIEHPARIQDKLSYQLQLRLDLINDPNHQFYKYPVINTSGTMKEYIFENVGEEELILPIGKMTAIKLKREVVDSDKATYAWFAPKLNYLLVKLNQIKNGTEEFDVELKSVALTLSSDVQSEEVTSQ